MNKPQPTRPAPPASTVQRPERAPEAAPARRPVRSAQRPEASSELNERVARAWARHPVVAMARHRQQLTFYRGLYTMIRSGIPLTTAFLDLSRGGSKEPFLQAVAQVGAAVEKGSTLAEAMRRHPRWFEQLVVNQVEASEVSGTLEKALGNIVEQLEEAQRLRWRTVSLCLYPAYLLIAFLIGGSMLDGAGGMVASQGKASLAALLVGAFFSNLSKVLGMGLAVFFAPLAVAALGVERQWERVRLLVPLLGQFHRERQASFFCQILGSSLGAGLEAGRSLQMALESSGSAQLHGRAGAAVQQLRDGASLTTVVEGLEVLDSQSLQRVAIGERTGHLEATFQQLAKEHTEAGLRWLRGLVFTLIAVMALVLFVTNVGKIFQFQTGYFDRMENLSHDRFEPEP